MAAVATALAKIAIPLGVGLLFIASRKGKKDEDTDKAEDLTRRAVQAMQMANAQLLDMAADAFREEDADPTTAGLLDYQHGRMVSRGSKGFTSVPVWPNDKSLAIDNQEVAVRLIQLEGRAKALDAWAQAYDTVGAVNLAKQLRTKAAALRGVTDPKDEKAAKKAADKDKKRSADKKKADKKADEKAKTDSKAKDDLSSVVKEVTDALASGSIETMRKVADKLRARGYTEQADSLDAAANELEAELKAKKEVEKSHEAEKAGKPEPGNMGDPLTKSLITMLIGKSPGQEDTFLVKKWQTANRRTADGKYGPGDGLYMAETLKVVPPSPLYWPKSNTQKSLTAWHQEMSRFSIERPTEANGYIFADKAGYQPGFEGVGSGVKIVSRRYNDGLGNLPSRTTSKPSGGTTINASTKPSSGRATLRKGSNGSDVKYLQTKLGVTPVDGAFGPITDKAVRSFQQAQGLKVDGIVGPNTWKALEGYSGSTMLVSTRTTPAVSRPTLRKGSNGSDVKYLQTKLGITADGAFGPKTESAVKTFQQKQGLVADGIVGPLTWNALEGLRTA
jgi:peptidoglycan hydrolase-like protein with peptidoglycan-binding domain